MRVERVTAVLVLAITGGARAQPAPPIPAPPPAAAPAPAEATPVPPPPQAPAASCVPGCRSGFVCVSGACVSACNPPCPAGQECADGGRCVAAQPSPSKEVVKQAIDEYFEEKSAEYKRKTVHRHDGGYFRFGFNFGYAWGTAEQGGVETTSRGVGGFLEYAFGGTLSNHTVLAFAHHTFGVYSPETSVGGEDLASDHSAFYQVFGLLLDYYPDPTRGWHVTLTLGPGHANVQVRNDENTEIGLGLALGGGYDFWVGEQWSLGAGARLIYISGAEDDFGEHRAIIPTAAFSALWH